MDERPKIHIFLGAPPPASIFASDAGTEKEERPPAGWRHLELTWRGRRLKAAAGETGSGSGSGSEVYPWSFFCPADVSFSVIIFPVER